MICELTKEMIKYNADDLKRIMHALKVHSLARTIGISECLDENTQFILESAAVLHDIGIKVCEEKYGSTGGKLQEKEGPLIAEPILERLNYTSRDIERILFLIANHHTYSNIDGIDYQILVEADFLVNLEEENSSKKSVESVYRKIFKTNCGKEFLKDLFSV